MSAFGNIDLNILRGWTEERDPRLQGAHALPALGRLVHLDSEQVEPLHGPSLLVGRYHPQGGPVDLIPGGLKDHENYRLGAPHLHLTMGEDGQWWFRHLSPTTHTTRNGQKFEEHHEAAELNDGDELVLGCVRYRFEHTRVALSDWDKAREALLDSADVPTLFLCRRGGPCGPKIELDTEAPRLLGRAIPSVEDFLPDAPWAGQLQKPVHPDVNLAGLFPAERMHIGFLHATIKRATLSFGPESPAASSGDFKIVPIALRHRTYLNRQDIMAASPLYHGDEIALGTVFFYLHFPGAPSVVTRQTIEAPVMVDWGVDTAPTLTNFDAFDDTEPDDEPESSPEGSP